jgi:hypothetical protein
MTAKILAGLVAAVLVTGAGVFVAFSGGTADEKPACGSLPVSEGACCALKAKSSCCDSGGSAACGSMDALAACAGSAALGTSPKGCTKLGCCDD